MSCVWNRASAAMAAVALAAVLGGCGGGESAVAVGQATSFSSSSPLRAATREPLRTSATVDPFTVTTLLDWAPSHYPQFFSRSYRVGTLAPYAYREYPVTATSSNYLGYDANNVIYAKLGDQPIFTVGTLTDFECQVLPSHCPVTDAPSSAGEAFSGLYVGNSAGPSPYAWMLVAADGSFIGTNSSADSTRYDIFTGNAVVQEGAWSASSIRYGSYTTTATYANLGSANASGTFVPQTSAAGNLAVSGVASVGSQLAMDFNSKSRTPASLWIAGGSYVYPPYGTNLTIDTATGAVSGTIQTNCSLAGTLTVPSAKRNVYKLAGTLSGTSCPFTGPVDFFGFYDSNNYQQAFFLYGTTPGSQLAFTAVVLYRNS